jgi:hypothetical protein
MVRVVGVLGIGGKQRGVTVEPRPPMYGQTALFELLNDPPNEVGNGTVMNNLR